MPEKVHTRYIRLSAIVTVVILALLILSSVIFLFLLNKERAQGQAAQKVTPSATGSTPSVTPSLTPQPLFYDDFTGPNKGWYVNDAGGYMRLLVNDSLELSDTNHDVLIESLPTDRAFSDFVLTVVFTIDKASWDDSVGVYVRGDSNLDHDYRIDIYGNNSFSISKEYLDADKEPQTLFLVDPTETPYLNPTGQQNVLTVTMNGPQMIVRLNGYFLASVSDTDYTSGQIALFVQGSQSSSQVAASFSSVAVFPLPDQALPSEIATPGQAAHPPAQKYVPRRAVSERLPARQSRSHARDIRAPS